MHTKNIIDIIDALVVFILDINIPLGSKRLRPEDLAANGVDIQKLPPAALSSLGSKRFISPTELAPFQAIKRSAERLLIANGTRFLRGYAVPEDRADALNQEILSLKIKFEHLKDDFLRGYEEAVENWVLANPSEWEGMIRSAVDTPAKVSRALSFNFAPVKIQSPKQLEVSDEDHGNTGLAEQASGLFGQLCHEVRQMAKIAYTDSYVGKLSITRKALRPISAIKEKLAGLSFLDSSIAETISVIDETLNRLPKTGPIEKSDLDMVAGLVGRRLANFGRTMPVEPEQPEEEDTEEQVEQVVATGVAVPPVIILPPSEPMAAIAPLAFDF